MGDLSRSGASIDSLCILQGYDAAADEYIGNWITGFGFMDVRYPADTVRELTDEEYHELDGKGYAINSTVYSSDSGGQVRRTNHYTPKKKV